MGCCIIGAIILSRWIAAFERARRLFAWLLPVSQLQNAGGERAAFRLFGRPVRSRAVMRTALAVELTVLAAMALHQGPWKLTHADHILSLLPFAPAQSAAVEAGKSICRSDGDLKARADDPVNTGVHEAGRR